MCAEGVPVLICDATHKPSGMMLPLASHFSQASVFAKQAKISLPLKKSLWKEIVRSKIKAQAEALDFLGLKCPILEKLRQSVRSGDASNMEGQAARVYWGTLFGHKFTRDSECGINHCLNYGYAILRAAVLRATCGAGLHPSLGLYHHSRTNPFCLADDLMEPYRPAIDVVTYQLSVSMGSTLMLSRETKTRILTAVSRHYYSGGERRTLFDWVTHTAFSLVASMDSADRVFFPAFRYEDPASL